VFRCQNSHASDSPSRSTATIYSSSPPQIILHSRCPQPISVQAARFMIWGDSVPPQVTDRQWMLDCRYPTPSLRGTNQSHITTYGCERFDGASVYHGCIV
jgi:hypothetical protein